MPFGIAADVGSTCSDCSTGFVTDAFREPLVEPLVAVMLKVPFDTLCTTPDALTVATDEGVVVQVAEFVMFEVVPSVNVAVAVSCFEVPRGSDTDEGVI